jgi:hypothetical protein
MHRHAMKALANEIRNDPMYAWSWHCSLAMTAHDEGLDKPAANRASARFMKMAFDVDMTKHEFFADTQT